MSGSGGIAPPFLTSALDGGEWSASRPGWCTPREKGAGTHWIGAGWAPEQVWTLWSREKSLVPAGNQTPAIQPIAILTEVMNNEWTFKMIHCTVHTPQY
jgi:hypothetical protein